MYILSGCVVTPRNEVNSQMSRNNRDAYGIEPFAPERDDELAAEALREEMMQASEEPIRPTEEDDDEQTDMTAWANTTDDMY